MTYLISQLLPGGRVLVRNVGLKGKNKLADKWQKEVYLVVNRGEVFYLCVGEERGNSDKKNNTGQLFFHEESIYEISKP